MASIREPADVRLTAPAAGGVNFIFAARE